MDLVGQGNEDGAEEDVVDLETGLGHLLLIGENQLDSQECQERTGQQQVVSISFYEVMAGDGSWVNVMLTEWSDEVLEHILLGISCLVKLSYLA